MKKAILFLFSLSVATVVFSQDNICESSYMPFKSGTSFELTNYDKKGKETSKVHHTVSSLDAVNSGFNATVEMETFDAKGKSIQKGTYSMECRDGVIYMDMSAMLDPRSMQGFKDMEMELSGDALQFPNKLTPGETLPDGTLQMKASTGGLALMSINMTISNRKVEAAESVTTAAGTFDCMKISQDSEMKTIIKMKFKTAAWYAKGVGMVKSENYDNKGNMESSTILTKFEKG